MRISDDCLWKVLLFLYSKAFPFGLVWYWCVYFFFFSVTWNLFSIRTKNQKIQKQHTSRAPSRLCTCTQWCSVLTRVGCFRFPSKNKSTFRVTCDLFFIRNRNQTKNQKIQKQHTSRAPSRLCTCTQWCSVLTRVGCFRFTSKNKSTFRVTCDLFFIRTKNETKNQKGPSPPCNCWSCPLNLSTLRISLSYYLWCYLPVYLRENSH